VDRLFPRQPFTGFGPSGLHSAADPPLSFRVEAARPGPLRREVRALAPRRQPGVYGMLNPRGELIYVGKAKCLRTRLLSYFRSKSRDPKAGRILQHTRALVWEPVFSEFAALLRELELIHRWQPRFNVHGQPHRRRRVYVCIGRPPAPYVFLASKPPARLSTCFGPVPAGDWAREAVRRLNERFGLRDCPQSQEMAFADQTELFPILRAAGCIRHEIATCLGPCAGGCTQRNYAQQVRAAQAFLDGANVSLLDQLQTEMAAASAALAFERAAALRDKWEALNWLHLRLERMRQIRGQETFVYPVRGIDGREIWYVIDAGRVVRATPAPQNGEDRRAFVQKIKKPRRRMKDAGSLVPPGEIEQVLMVAAWFRRRPEERQRRIELAKTALV
jgi:excinuclease ABC subunit C